MGRGDKLIVRSYGPARLIGCFLSFWAVVPAPHVSLAEGAATTATVRAAAPSPTPTEVFEEFRCGNGIREPGEACDDGNTFGGDGCSEDCSPETLVTSSFEPVLEYVVLPGAFDSFFLRGTVTFAISQSNRLALRSLDLVPAIVFGGYVCTRAVVSPEQFGPGNVGIGSLGGQNVSIHLLRITVSVERWYGEADRGPDGLPCTDDDPKLDRTPPYDLQLQLSLAVPEPCAGDSDGDGKVTIDEIIAAVHNGLTQCPLTPLSVVP
jgi:cysteine-rich repeat protein